MPPTRPRVCEHFEAMSFQATGGCFLHSQVPTSGSVKSGGLGDGPKSRPPLPARRDSQHDSTTAKLRLTVPHQCQDIFTPTETAERRARIRFAHPSVPLGVDRAGSAALRLVRLPAYCLSPRNCFPRIELAFSRAISLQAGFISIKMMGLFIRCRCVRL
jgi:hypothetical protein